jgi:hypothetical protein
MINFLVDVGAKIIMLIDSFCEVLAELNVSFIGCSRAEYFSYCSYEF